MTASEMEVLAGNLIELFFAGSSEISIHPFYSQIWRGLFDGLSGTKYKLVLAMLEEDPESGGVKRICRKFIPSAAKILIGMNAREQINLLKKRNIPFILAGNKPFDNTPSVYVSIFKALNHTLKNLSQTAIKK